MMQTLPIAEIPLQEIAHELFHQKGISVALLRLDEIHPTISGNKWFKLKHNLLHAAQQQFKGVLTFGGQYSNHIYATAAAARELGLKSVGMIGGGDKSNLTSTLEYATAQGMELNFITRELYRKKSSTEFLRHVEAQYPGYYIIPEGGTNELALKGCAEIPQLVHIDFDILITACGTGGTLAGIATGLKQGQSAIGVSVLKGDDTLTSFIAQLHGSQQLNNWKVISGYHFGGYAKAPNEVVAFIHTFKEKYAVQLEQVYTAKMMMAIFDMASRNCFPTGTRIVALHTGGLQGLNV